MCTYLFYCLNPCVQWSDKRELYPPYLEVLKLQFAVSRMLECDMTDMTILLVSWCRQLSQLPFLTWMSCTFIFRLTPIPRIHPSNSSSTGAPCDPAAQARLPDLQRLRLLRSGAAARRAHAHGVALVPAAPRGGAWGNHSQCWYTRRPSNIEVEDPLFVEESRLPGKMGRVHVSESCTGWV